MGTDRKKMFGLIRNLQRNDLIFDVSLGKFFGSSFADLVQKNDSSRTDSTR